MDLVAFQGDCEEQGEGGVDEKQRVVALLLTTVGSILARVQKPHCQCLPISIAGIEMKRNLPWCQYSAASSQ